MASFPLTDLVVLYFSFHTRQAMVPQLSCTMGKNETPPHSLGRCSEKWLFSCNIVKAVVITLLG